jgi:putative transposase
VTCRVVGVSVSGFYMWRKRKPSARAVRHAMVAEVIRQVHDECRQTYGARRVHAELVLGREMTVARCTVELIMRRLGLAGLPGRPRYRRIPNTPSAEDLVNRDFARTEPNRLWLTDITEHPTREGKVCCAVVLYAFSRRVVGWSIDSSQTSNLVVNALGMAIENRQAEGVVIHSDHGTQGGFNWWSQHLTRMEVVGGATAAVGGQGASPGDAVAGSTDPGASCGTRRLQPALRVLLRLHGSANVSAVRGQELPLHRMALADLRTASEGKDLDLSDSSTGVLGHWIPSSGSSQRQPSLSSAP